MIITLLQSVVNILIVVLAVFSCACAWRIWRLTRYIGMLWLFLSLIYASLLRALILFYIQSITNIIVWGMFLFWAGLLYALWRLVGQIEEVMQTKKGSA